MRIADALCVFLVVLLGAHLSGHLSSEIAFNTSILDGLAGFFIAAGAIALNDYFDLAIDQINKPGRPIPSGQISPTSAKWIGVICYLIGILLSSLHGTTFIIFACILAGFAHFYNRYLKKTFLANFMVGFLCVGSLIYGFGEIPNSWRLIFASLLIFTFVTSREILKTVEDYEGDRQASVVNITTRFGTARAINIYHFTSALVIILSMIPFALNHSNFPYLMTMVLGVDLLIMVGCWYMFPEYSQEQIRIALRLSKMSFFFGLLGLALI